MAALPAKTVALGNPQSSTHQIDPVQLADWMEQYEAMAGTNGALSYIDGSLSDLQARSGTTNGEYGLVVTTADEGGVYELVSGTWTKRADIPSIFVESLAADEAKDAQTAAEAAKTGAQAAKTGAQAAESGAETARTQAELAATAAGATLYDSTANGLSGTSDGDVFLVATTPGVQVYRNDAGSETFLGWLGAVLVDDVTALLASTDTFADDTIVRTRSEGFAYRATDTATATTVANAGGQDFEVLPINGKFFDIAFGVKHDNSTNNYAALKKAVDAAAGAELVIADGIALVSQGVEIEAGLKIRGPGTIKSSGTNQDVFYGNGINHCHFDSLRIEGNQTGEGSNTLGLGGNGIKMVDAEWTKVTNCHFDYIGKTPEGTASYACPISIKGGKVIVTGNTFGENCFNMTGADVGVDRTNDTIISDNISHSECDAFVSISAVANAAGTDVVRHSVTGNIALRKTGSRCRSAILAYYDAQPGYVAITGNYIEGFTWNGVYGSGSVASTTTQDAGGMSISGNTIRYCGGRHTITAGIYVAGEAGATVSGNFLRDIGYDRDGTARADSCPGIGVFEHSQNISVTGNTIVNVNGRGINLRSFAGGIKDCSVVGNSIRGTTASPIRVASESAGVQCENIVVSANVCRHTADVDGIIVDRSNSGENRNISVVDNICECEAASATGAGVIFNNSNDGGRIAGNRLIGYDFGIRFSNGTDRNVPSIMKVESNHIKDCATGFFGGDKVAIEFGNTYENVTTVYGYRSYGGRPIGDDGAGNLLVEYIDVAGGPYQGNWYRGDRLILDTPSVDGNNMVQIGKVCTAAGTHSTSTWVAQYISTVSPAT